MQCDIAHYETCARSSRGSLPLIRLLEINNDRIRLVELDPSVKVRYICLAHRWAARQPWEHEEDISSPYATSLRCRTLISNLNNHKDEVILDDLLFTYQDAVNITKRLGLNYLWIDSLCIVQDDEDDVRLQISQMGSIYGNSYLTVAADALKDHTQSLFSDRKWRWRAHEQIVVDSRGFNHTLFFRERPEHSHLGWDGLFDRAWCFQERLLSPRIIRFQAREVIFECNKALICECGNPPAGHQGPWEDITKSAHLHDKVAFNALLSPDSKVSVTESWHHLVHAYSKTHLTRESDRMNAFAGIVGLYHERSMSDSQYLAGLWSHSLWSDLLWSVTPIPLQLSTVQPTASTCIPSWSWMSINLGDHAIAYSKFKVQQTLPRLNKIHYGPMSANLPLGDVGPGAYLEIEGLLTPVPVSKILETWHEKGGSSSLMPSIKWDLEMPDCKSEEVLSLLKIAHLRNDPIVREAFLLLRSLKPQNVNGDANISSFRRIGYMEIAKDELQLCRLLEPRIVEEYKTIRLY
ncbi:heterokaryon incompatibility protein-domain-containing protein [Phaeosphaeria sp. MPI-PUGE-AT-0046c]|nr:heterokaryon incompatibility protein-domain-containing protein [Phaeosphaeria sp. MPI-PUGE-AT-0046c]